MAEPARCVGVDNAALTGLMNHVRGLLARLERKNG
jgi:hypothetical protein